uniref:PARP-type domain-containing protein n=1 Tax=Panagrolaimus superbus TaxID=310955 RepID=A0A914ZA20_9BILA
MLNQKSYFFQHSKSNNSICRSCNQLIPQDEIRVYRNDYFEIFPYPRNGWFHLKCFWLLEEVKTNINEKDVMLEIESRERNYENEFWQYQKHKIIKNNTQFSLHDGQNSCFYTSMAFFDSTNSKISLKIDESELLGIRKKIAEIKDLMNNTVPSTPIDDSVEELASNLEKQNNLAKIKDSLNDSISSSSSSGYASAEDFSDSFCSTPN